MLSFCSLHTLVEKRGVTVFQNILPIKFVPIQRTEAPVLNTHSFMIFHAHCAIAFADHRIHFEKIFPAFFQNHCHFVNTPDHADLIPFPIHSTDSTTHLILLAPLVTTSVPILPILSGRLNIEFFTLPSHLQNLLFGGSF